MITKTIFISLLTLLMACGTLPQHKGITYIRIKGSDTMSNLTNLWAEEYMKTHPDISIYSEGGGSAMGLQALINGEVNICASSRPMLPHEVRQLAEKHNKLGIAFMVAKDALSVYLHPRNPIRNLSMQQLKNIFTGKITSWNEISEFYNEPILVINRTPNSGTYLYFKEHVLSDNAYTTDATIVPNTQAVVSAIIKNPNAIGYGGTAYGPEVIHCRIDGVAPTIKNVSRDLYPIARYLYLYTIDTPTGKVKDFIDWILAMQGQALVAKVGYIPLWYSVSF
jgi:phosphate transport system substrate-binding protein